METIILSVLTAIFLLFPVGVDAKATIFRIQSVDTMKYSRDMARDKLNDAEFDGEISGQMRLISESGATHVAIATPYDAEFIPYLRRWVNHARKAGLKVWFRGNLSGWEGWFDYERIGREEHIRLVREFINGNPDLFEDGDVFSSCPECENGGDGDPRRTGDVRGFRDFLTEEYDTVNRSFLAIGKKVLPNAYSMNLDVAELVMDRKTAAKLGGIVTIDHYVRHPRKFIEDVDRIHRKSGAKILVGEFGAPIPDIHGEMDERSQAAWTEETLKGLQTRDFVLGVNYWTLKGGSSTLTDGQGTTNLTYGVIRKYFSPVTVEGRITDGHGNPVNGVTVTTDKGSVGSGNGKYRATVLPGSPIGLHKPGYRGLSFIADNKPGETVSRDAVLKGSDPDKKPGILAGLLERIRKVIVVISSRSD